MDLEFDTDTVGVALLGTLSLTLVTVDELVRDLASLAASRSGAEYRNIEIVAIEMRNPLTVRLSLVAIAPEAVHAFQEMCREVIRGRAIDIPSILDRCLPHSVVTAQETQRLDDHAAALQRAPMLIMRFRISEE